MHDSKSRIIHGKKPHTHGQQAVNKESIANEHAISQSNLLMLGTSISLQQQKQSSWDVETDFTNQWVTYTNCVYGFGELNYGS